MSAGTYLRKCYGFNPRTGGRVGERHRWGGDVSGPGWGKGRCIWCHRDLQQLLVHETTSPSPPKVAGA